MVGWRAFEGGEKLFFFGFLDFVPLSEIHLFNDQTGMVDLKLAGEVEIADLAFGDLDGQRTPFSLMSSLFLNLHFC